MQQDVKDLIQAESYLAGLEAAEVTIPERLQAAAETGDFAVYATVQAEMQALPALLNRARIQVLKLQNAAIDVQITEEKARLAESIEAYKVAQAAAAPAPTPVPSPVRYVEEAPGSATVLTLGAHMCKWPIGDPSSEGFTFCGKGANATGSTQRQAYCVEHARIAFQPATGGKKKATANELTRSLRRYI